MLSNVDRGYYLLGAAAMPLWALFHGALNHRYMPLAKHRPPLTIFSYCLPIALRFLLCICLFGLTSLHYNTSGRGIYPPVVDTNPIRESLPECVKFKKPLVNELEERTYKYNNEDIMKHIK
uniref:Uncharacterized protein n=1 Tax=Cacopsylla melanoneura TaxID=428564 RepID=A0A8D8WCR3_9HEMI